MDNKARLFRRLVALVCILAALGCIAFFALFRIQIVEGETYRSASERKLTSTIPVTASRGEISDRYGRPLISNRPVFSLRIDYVYWDRAAQNDTILKLAKLVRESGVEPVDSLPISAIEPFEFLEDPDARTRTRLNQRLTEAEITENEAKAAAMTAEEVVGALRTYYKD